MARNAGPQIIRIAVVSRSRRFRDFVSGVLERSDDMKPVRLASSVRTIEPYAAGIDVTILQIGNGDDDDPDISVLPDLPVLVVSEDRRRAEALLRLRTGAWGWAPPHMTGNELAAAVRAIHEGFISVHASAGPTTDISSPYRAESDGGHAPRGERDDVRLTAREREILELLSEGYTNGEMSNLLGISENTVKFHIRLLYDHLGVSTRAEAMREGIRRGLLTV